MPEIAEVSITYDKSATAETAARDLVDAQLAACVHVSGPISSVFRWDGAVQTEPEWRLTAKTRVDLTQAVLARLSESHPYDLPGVVLHRCETTQAFADWVAAETAAADPH